MEFSASIDSTLVEQIATQLGIAVDAAATYLDQYLPAYAQLKALQIICPIVCATVLFIVCVIAALVFFRIAKKHLKADIEAETKEEQSYCRYMTISEGNDIIQYTTFWIGIIVSAIGVIAFLVAIVYVGCHLPEVITWQNAPEAMLLDSVLKNLN